MRQLRITNWHNQWYWNILNLLNNLWSTNELWHHLFAADYWFDGERNFRPRLCLDLFLLHCCFTVIGWIWNCWWCQVHVIIGHCRLHQIWISEGSTTSQPFIYRWVEEWVLTYEYIKSLISFIFSTSHLNIQGLFKILKNFALKRNTCVTKIWKCQHVWFNKFFPLSVNIPKCHQNVFFSAMIFKELGLQYVHVWHKEWASMFFELVTWEDILRFCFSKTVNWCFVFSGHFLEISFLIYKSIATYLSTFILLLLF